MGAQLAPKDEYARILALVLPTLQSHTMSVETVEINDAIFCSPHIREVCGECGYDGREENDAFYGFDPIDREPLASPSVTVTKDGLHQCKKHGSTGCSQCFGWKKQITRARTAAKKAGKK